MVMGASGSKLEKALGDQFPEGERYFGLENFGNTCYCNSVLQVLVSFPLLLLPCWVFVSDAIVLPRLRRHGALFGSVLWRGGEGACSRCPVLGFPRVCCGLGCDGAPIRSSRDLEELGWDGQLQLKRESGELMA